MMLTFKTVTGLVECKKLWEKFSTKKILWDLWDFRYCFHNSKFNFILGMDTFRDFATWKNVRKILESVHLAVATRPGYPNDLPPKTLQALMDDLPFSYQLHRQANEVQVYLCEETGKTLVFCDIEPLDISSSEIRERVKCGLSVKNMLPPEVERYIMTHRLYQANPRP